MRLKKNGQLIKVTQTQKLDPFRTIKLTPREIELVKSIPSFDGMPVTDEVSENILHNILIARGMGELLYPEKEDWSGYVKLVDDTLWLL